MKMVYPNKKEVRTWIDQTMTRTISNLYQEAKEPFEELIRPELQKLVDESPILKEAYAITQRLDALVEKHDKTLRAATGTNQMYKYTNLNNNIDAAFGRGLQASIMSHLSHTALRYMEEPTENLYASTFLGDEKLVDTIRYMAQDESTRAAFARYEEALTLRAQLCGIVDQARNGADACKSLAAVGINVEPLYEMVKNRNVTALVPANLTANVSLFNETLQKEGASE